VNVAGDSLLRSECCGICVETEKRNGLDCVQNWVNVNKSGLVNEVGEILCLKTLYLAKIL
jgi:hypothetical protein